MQQLASSLKGCEPAVHTTSGLFRGDWSSVTWVYIIPKCFPPAVLSP